MTYFVRGGSDLVALNDLGSINSSVVVISLLYAFAVIEALVCLLVQL
jgi:hypothetical protein